MVQKTEIRQPKSALATVSCKTVQDYLFLGLKSLMKATQHRLFLTYLLLKHSSPGVFFQVHQNLQK